VSRRVVLLALGALLAVLCAWPEPSVALAHPLDEYLQALYVTLASDRVELELDLTPGVLVAPQVVALIDSDGDGQISEGEARAYARRVLSEVRVKVDQQPYGLVPTAVVVPPMLNLTAGAGLIHLEAAAVGPDGTGIPPRPAGAHRVSVWNGHAPVKSTYQSAVVLQRAGEIEVRQQSRDDLQQRLRVDYSVVAPASADAGAAPAIQPPASGTPSAPQQWMLDALAQPAQSPWALIVALALSAALGGLHGLTPGHGKALLATYLVGSRGTVRHAVFLGGSLTFTHTASVVAISVLALFAGQLLVPDLLVPALELSSGLLVVVLGVRLVRARWRSLRPGHTHDHAHPHPTDGVRWRHLAAMGVSGGLTPCPEAIGILLVAIGLNRVALGLGLITAFSLGLASVLCVLGLLLVRARGLVDRFGALGHRGQGFLPLCSALVVTLLGAGIALRGVLAAVHP
jgi:nickel/cobalt transporter (NicO) family protein